jgi:hypothetical protein
MNDLVDLLYFWGQKQGLSPLLLLPPPNRTIVQRFSRDCSGPLTAHITAYAHRFDSLLRSLRAGSGR